MNELVYKQSRLVKLFFYANEQIETKLKVLDYVRFSFQYECYYMKWKDDNFERLRKDLEGVAIISDKYIHYKTVEVDKLDKLAMSNSVDSDGLKIRPAVSFIFALDKVYVKLPVPAKREWWFFLKESKGYYEERRRLWIFSEKAVRPEFVASYFRSQGCIINVNKKEDVDMVVHRQRMHYKNDEEIQLYIKALTLQGASKRTIENYACQIKKMKNYYAGRKASEITDEEIRDYLFFLREDLGYSTSVQNIVVSAIKRFLLSVTDREFNPLHIPRPIKRRTLPKTLEKESIIKLLKAVCYVKHKCILYLLYSTGIRCGELINLKVEDINFDNNVITIKKGKGGKDRIVFLPGKLKDILIEYLRQEKPTVYLLEGQDGGKYSATSVQRVVKNAVRKAGIDKRVTPHMLRHSFATHLHDSGIDIRHIQVLLGHTSTKTTEIYTHISKKDINQLRSPLDDLDI